MRQLFKSQFHTNDNTAPVCPKDKLQKIKNPKCDCADSASKINELTLIIAELQAQVDQLKRSLAESEVKAPAIEISIQTDVISNEISVQTETSSCSVSTETTNSTQDVSTMTDEKAESIHKLIFAVAYYNANYPGCMPDIEEKYKQRYPELFWWSKKPEEVVQEPQKVRLSKAERKAKAKNNISFKNII